MLLLALHGPVTDCVLSYISLAEIGLSVARFHRLVPTKIRNGLSSLPKDRNHRKMVGLSVIVIPLIEEISFVADLQYAWMS